MNIIEKLKASIEASTGEVFHYGGTQAINRVLEGAALPCSVAYLIEQGQVTDVNGFIHEKLSLAVFFINKTEFDPDSIENEDIIDTEKKKAFGWIARLRRNSDLRLDSVNGSQRVYDTFDSIVTGYAVNVTITEEAGVSECNAPSPAPQPDEDEEEEDDVIL